VPMSEYARLKAAMCEITQEMEQIREQVCQLESQNQHGQQKLAECDKERK